jgi:hypothetical protein
MAVAPSGPKLLELLRGQAFSVLLALLLLCKSCVRSLKTELESETEIDKGKEMNVIKEGGERICFPRSGV